jgi:membrane protease YdiL (CAAX protease family)
MTFVPLTFLAMTFVLLYERTQTLLAPILTHALFNAVNFTLFLFQK